MQVPYVGWNFAVYESLKDWLVKDNPFGLVENNELTIITRLSCGSIAGTVGQTIAYPLDVIHRRMQMVGWKRQGRSKASLEYNGMVDAFRKTVRHEALERCTRMKPPFLKSYGRVGIGCTINCDCICDI
ncbi:Mitochondrial adenine nucleotide transporter ADNT1 [Raphanus sativus]|nr:Mitochondrial adenine nucleotide transporter ADNT1 [Raphanus sativus]